jgi:isopenicillin N synthase-like dioxygenase
MAISAAEKEPAHIPVIDFAGALSPELGARRAVARAIREACRDTGFFYVRNHGVPEDTIERTVALSRAFFARPREAKLELAGVGGYGYEAPELQTLDEAAPPDTKEGFMMGEEGSPLAATVKWPEDMPEFRAQLDAYAAQMRGLGRAIVHSLALSLDLEETYFDDGYVEPSCSVRLLHYAPKTKGAAPNQWGAGAHTDWGAITMLHQDEVGGLEILGPDGEWLPATPTPGTFVVNLGDMIRRWTNDQYRSTLHRVRSSESSRDRYSIATFFSPAESYRVLCVPTCLAEGEAPHYAPCTVGEHFAEMVRKTYAGAA